MCVYGGGGKGVGEGSWMIVAELHVQIDLNKLHLRINTIHISMVE